MSEERGHLVRQKAQQKPKEHKRTNRKRISPGTASRISKAKGA